MKRYGGGFDKRIVEGFPLCQAMVPSVIALLANIPQLKEMRFALAQAAKEDAAYQGTQHSVVSLLDGEHDDDSDGDGASSSGKELPNDVPTPAPLDDGKSQCMGKTMKLRSDLFTVHSLDNIFTSLNISEVLNAIQWKGRLDNAHRVLFLDLDPFESGRQPWKFAQQLKTCKEAVAVMEALFSQVGEGDFVVNQLWHGVDQQCIGCQVLQRLQA